MVLNNAVKVQFLIPTDKGYTIKKVGENDMISQIKKFDNGFPDGVFAIQRPSKEPRVKVRALHDYCKIKGITPDKLSRSEMERFLVQSI